MKRLFPIVLLLPFAVACQSNNKTVNEQSDTVKISTDQEKMPTPSASKTKFSKVIGWPTDKTPIAPKGFLVTKFAENIKSPRNIYRVGKVRIPSCFSEIPITMVNQNCSPNF